MRKPRKISLKQAIFEPQNGNKSVASTENSSMFQGEVTPLLK